jgi:hypothetical protein
MSRFANWLDATPATVRDQKAWIYEQALHSILRLSGCTTARALAAAALANSRDEQDRLTSPPMDKVPA